MLYKTITAPSGLKAVSRSGRISAIVSVTGLRDKQNDVILPGAFNKARSASKLPKFCFSRDWEIPLGKTLDAVLLKCS